MAAGNKDEVDDFYELISLADRLSSVSKQLQGKYITVAFTILKLLNIKSSKAFDKMAFKIDFRLITVYCHIKRYATGIFTWKLPLALYLVMKAT